MRENVRFFSADRRGFYARGELTLWKQNPLPNPQAFLSSHRKDFSSSDIREHMNAMFPDGLSLHGWDYATRCYPPVEGDHDTYLPSSLMIELVFEQVRRAHFPLRLSRLQAFFAFESIARVRRFSPSSPIYELKPAAAFRADQTWLNVAYQMPVASYNAHRYWSGDASATPDWEYLLPAPVRTIPLTQEASANPPM